MNKNVHELESKTYTAEDVAVLLGISRSAAYALFKEPDFPCIALGRRLMVAQDKFDEWLNHAHERRVS